MNNKNLSTKSIKEELHLSNLTPEEKAARGILGRLYGPCASFFDPTRNERFYDENLWDNVFTKNEIVDEMFKCGGIPMELDHPEADRDETKSMNIAAIMPEKPKKDENGHLIAYIDILDTPAGRIAYTLAKYGFKWGISSRGSGDLYTDSNGNEAVDPDTYDFQTFDLVLLPAVKDARLNMTESFNKNKTKIKKVKKALTELYKAYGDEEKLIMKENLDKLNINISEDLAEDADMVNVDELPTEVHGEPVERLYIDKDGAIVDDQIVESLHEAVDDDDDYAEYINGAKKYAKQIADMSDKDAEDLYYNEYGFDKSPAQDEAEKIIQAALEKKLNLVESAKITEAKEDDANEEETEDMTVADVIEDFKTLGEDKFIEFEVVEIDGVEYEADVVISEETDDTVVLKTVLTPVEQDEDIDAEDSDDEEVAEAGAEEDAAEDDGADEVVESMKKLVRQNKMLESEIKSLTNEKTVSDAKVKELTEELNKVRAGFVRTGELAAKAKSAAKMTESLKADLEKKDREIATLKKRVSANTKMNESVSVNADQVKLLKENLATTQTELTESKKKLQEQVAQSNDKIKKITAVATKYKEGYLTIMQKFVESKANMLGVKPVEITNRLSESYTVDEVEKVCEMILNGNRNNSRLPIGRTSRVSINESTQSKKRAEELTIHESGFEVADWLDDYR